MEELRGIHITVEVETNKTNYRLNLVNEYDTEEAVEKVKNFIKSVEFDDFNN